MTFLTFVYPSCSASPMCIVLLPISLQNWTSGSFKQQKLVSWNFGCSRSFKQLCSKRTPTCDIWKLGRLSQPSRISNKRKFSVLPEETTLDVFNLLFHSVHYWLELGVSHISRYLHSSSKTSEATPGHCKKMAIRLSNNIWQHALGTSWTWPKWWLEAARQHQGYLCCMLRLQPTIQALDARNASRERVDRRTAQKDASRGRGKWHWRGRGRRRARPRPTAQPTGGGGGRHARTGCSAANPQQNASGSTAATVQQDECGLRAANP